MIDQHVFSIPLAGDAHSHEDEECRKRSQVAKDGTAIPTIDNLVVLATVFGVTMDEIVVPVRMISPGRISGTNKEN